jgi:hypothetical protein
MKMMFVESARGNESCEIFDLILTHLMQFGKEQFSLGYL